MAVKYDKNTDYAAKMNAAQKSGDTKAYNEAKKQREAKMAGEGLDNSGKKINSNTGSGSGGSGSSKTPTTIYNPDGTTSAGYIQKSQTFYNNGSRIGNGATVKTADGKFYQMQNGIGVEVSGPMQYRQQDQKVDLMNDTTVTKPGAMTAAQLANLYGITYDFHTLNNMLQDAAEKKYNVAKNEMQQVEGQMYDTAYGFQNDLVASLKKGAGTVNQGASKGTFDANTLLTMLGYQQQLGDLATTVTQDKQQLGSQLALDKATATQTALENANKAGVDLANLASLFDANNTQYGVGTMDALARIFETKASAEATKESAAANAAAQVAAAKASAAGYAAGNKYTSDNTSSSAYKNIADLVNKGSYGDFYYLLRQAGASDDEIKNLWDQLVSANSSGGTTPTTDLISRLLQENAANATLPNKHQ